MKKEVERTWRKSDLAALLPKRQTLVLTPVEVMLCEKIDGLLQKLHYIEEKLKIYER